MVGRLGKGWAGARRVTPVPPPLLEAVARIDQDDDADVVGFVLEAPRFRRRDVAAGAVLDDVDQERVVVRDVERLVEPDLLDQVAALRDGERIVERRHLHEDDEEHHAEHQGEGGEDTATNAPDVPGVVRGDEGGPGHVSGGADEFRAHEKSLSVRPL